ncbi:MAG TPA: heparan-alpha-glucosaminide N-acetyltransferase domain-containing protein, partial [Polyangiaceae bacterium]|nr:heparan-alpha-glucosaminide N-acetyltransferase domain-containing protein [Polyangiaceae bacterium]
MTAEPARPLDAAAGPARPLDAATGPALPAAERLAVGGSAGEPVASERPAGEREMAQGLAVERLAGELPAAERPAAERLAFVDRLRGLATLAMIEVHVVNALLAPDFRGGPAFAALDFVNGLVAPSFLVAAGLSLARSFAPGARPWPDAPTRRRLAAGHARRAAALLALGYAMHASHLPAALSARGPAAAPAWALALQTDVLQLIALSLAALALAAALARSARRYAAGALAAAVGCAWLGPVAHLHSWEPLPLPLATFFTERFGSPFPALPWAAFVALGAALGASGPPASERHLWTRRLLAAAALGLALGALGAAFPWPLGGAYERWTLSPSATALRAGLVCLVAAALAKPPTEVGGRGHPLSRQDRGEGRKSKPAPGWGGAPQGHERTRGQPAPASPHSAGTTDAREPGPNQGRALT